MSTRNRSSSRPRFKRALTVRMIAAQTEWLEGPLFWQEGRVVWRHSRGEISPTASDLAAAQRALQKIEHYPIASKVLGDSDAWLAHRRERLQLAKRLSAIAAPDLALLARDSRTRNPATIDRLIELLSVEALCLNALPVSPGQILLRLDSSVDALHGFARDSAELIAGRALAALILGAHGQKKMGPAFDELWLQRAFDFGARHGLPTEASLIVTILADADGWKSARRLQRARQTSKYFELPCALLRELLGDGHSVECVVALNEAANQWESLAARCLPVEHELPALPLHSLTQLREDHKQYRRAWIAAMADVMRAFARHNGDAKILQSALALIEAMLDLNVVVKDKLNAHIARTGSVAITSLVLDAALKVLHVALELPPALQGAYLRLLLDHHARLWDIAKLPEGKKAHKTAGRVANWLEACRVDEARPLQVLLGRCEDATVAADALHGELHRVLSQQSWNDRELYRYALTLGTLFLNEARDWSWSNLCDTLDRFADARQARTTLAPIVDALRYAAPPLRHNLFFDLLDEIGSTRQGLCSVLPRSACYLPHLVSYLDRSGDLSNSTTAVEIMAALDATLRRSIESPFPLVSAFEAEDDRGDQSTLESDGELVDVELVDAELGDGEPDLSEPEEPLEARIALWLQWILDDLLELQKQDTSTRYWVLSSMTRLAATLAPDDFARFQLCFRAGIRHDPDENEAHIERGVEALGHFPALRAPLAELFPRQPARCLALLARLGLTQRLGADVLSPLEPFRYPTPTSDSPIGEAPLSDTNLWNELEILDADLALLAARYRHAQRLMNEPDSMPPGVRRALERPRKLATELAHLETQTAQQAPRADLQARVLSLRGQLADAAGLRIRILEEAHDALRQITAEAETRAAEARVLGCYRARLQNLIGPLPDAIDMDADLLNATLLTCDIEHNRKLLRQLLRAHLNGQADWREKHPANTLFLRGLQGRGIDAAPWLASHPRRYRLATARGGSVHLRLEHNPLHILQMGNYFDTCLSFGGINSFSTVANACELNKRVIFARDGSGRVIGRKLIAINEQAHLVGFHTYTSLHDAEANTALRHIFAHYAATFAARCDLQLGEEGNIPRLFAEDWYDDGIVPWHDENAAETRPPSFGGVAHATQSTLDLRNAAGV